MTTPHWEIDRDFFGTIKSVLTDPVAFYGMTPKSGSIKEPLIFGTIVLTFGTVMSMLWSILMEMAGITTGSALGMPETGGIDARFTIIVYGVLIVISPLLSVLTLFFFSAIVHLSVALLGGAKHNFDATFRAICYAETPAIFNIIPFCGMFISFIWTIVLAIIGLAELHEISGLKATIAVLIPFFICCACIMTGLVAAIAIAGIGMAGLMGGAGM